MTDSFYIIPRSGRLAYLNIPKAACSSILVALSHMRSDLDYQSPQGKLADGSSPIHGYHPAYNHLENFFCRWPLSYPSLPSLFIKFSFVRNPYHRFLSFYKSKIVARQSPGSFYEKFGIYEDCSFMDCVRIITSIDPHNLEHHSAPQANLLSDGERLYADFIGKIENFKSDWKVINRISGFDVQLEHVNKTPSDDGAVYNSESKELIYNYYRSDFELFNYDKDSIETTDFRSRNIGDISFMNPGFSFEVIKKLQNILVLSNKHVRELSLQQDDNGKERENFSSCRDELYRELILKTNFVIGEQLRKKTGTNGQKISSIQKLNTHHEEKFKDLHKININLQKHQDFLTQKQSEIHKCLGKSILATFKRSSNNPWKCLRRFIRSPRLNEIEFLNKSGLVDSHFYFENYPNTIVAGITATQHYVRYGAQEGNNPSAKFHSCQYLMENPDVAYDGINPLVHSILNKCNDSSIK